MNRVEFKALKEFTFKDKNNPQYVLSQIYYDYDNKNYVATDGKRLLIIPMSDEKLLLNELPKGFNVEQFARKNLLLNVEMIENAFKTAETKSFPICNNIMFTYDAENKSVGYNVINKTLKYNILSDIEIEGEFPQYLNFANIIDDSKEKELYNFNPNLFANAMQVLNDLSDNSNNSVYLKFNGTNKPCQMYKNYTHLTEKTAYAICLPMRHGEDKDIAKINLIDEKFTRKLKEVENVEIKADDLVEALTDIEYGFVDGGRTPNIIIKKGAKVVIKEIIEEEEEKLVTLVDFNGEFDIELFKKVV
jgi:hypothetical protein